MLFPDDIGSLIKWVFSFLSIVSRSHSVFHSGHWCSDFFMGLDGSAGHVTSKLVVFFIECLGPQLRLAHPRLIRPGCVLNGCLVRKREKQPWDNLCSMHSTLWQFNAFHSVMFWPLTETLFYRYISLKTTFTSNRMFRAARGGLHLLDRRASYLMALRTGCMRVRKDLHPSGMGWTF